MRDVQTNLATLSITGLSALVEKKIPVAPPAVITITDALTGAASIVPGLVGEASIISEEQ